MKKILLICLMLIASAFASHAQILYVDGARPDDNGDGSSWATAKKDLQVAFVLAAAYDLDVWVAKGTYIPIRPTNNLAIVSVGNRYNAFALLPNLKIYGGFAGTETLLSERDLTIAANASILSGDLSGNDGPNFANNTENAYHVVVSGNSDAPILLDGFTITGGNANGPNTAQIFHARSGGGVYINTGTLSLSNLIIKSNSSLIMGGGLYSTGATLNMNNNVVAVNKSGYGGGLYVKLGASTISNNVIAGNSCSSQGGGINLDEGNISAFNNTIVGNSAPNSGALYSYATGLISNNIFWNNTATEHPDILNEERISVFKNNLLQLAESEYGGVASEPLGQGASGNLFGIAPQLANTSLPAGTDGIFFTADDGLRLNCDSPGINSGMNTGVTESDILGLARIQNDVVDIGAYEFAKSVSENIFFSGKKDLSRSQSGTTYYAACGNLIATITSAGSVPLSGQVTVTAWVETVQLAKYVNRHYEIVAINNPSTATGTVKLFFTQAEFDAFNAVNDIKLPTGSGDAAGIANLLIERHAGKSSDGTGHYSSYEPAAETIAPVAGAVLYNPTYNRWEVTVYTTGFGGFWVKTRSGVYLSAVSPENGILSPAFTPATLIYSGAVAAATDFSITPVTTTPNTIISVKVNEGSYADVPNGSTPTVLPLVAGRNNVNIKLTSADGFLENFYTFTIRKAFLPPGNALAFDGNNDIVTIPNSANNPDFTIEAYIRTSADSPSGTFAYEGAPLLSADMPGDNKDFTISVLNNKIAFFDGGANANTYGTTTVTDGIWHHIAVVHRGGVSTKVYLDGIEDGTGVASNVPLTDNPVISLGGNSANRLYFNGSMDEVRIWKTARAQTEIKATMRQLISASAGNLQAYYNFDMGAYDLMTNLTDQSANAIHGLIINMDPASKVESYAMVVPVPSAATTFTTTGFTANWSASAVGTANQYLLDVSASATFDSFLDGYEALPVTGTSAVVTIPVSGSGRMMATSYYYRVRAEKDGLVGQGAYSPTITVTANPLPVNLISFTGKKMESANLLEWKVTNETQFDRYEVERSSDAKNFESIGIVVARSNEQSGITNYTFTDPNPQTINSKTAYYRLKMTDKDESYAYSRLIAIDGDFNPSSAVYPNPAAEIINIPVDASLLNTRAKVYDLTGRLVQTIRIAKSIQKVDVKNLAPGIYLITFENGSVQRFVKQ
ncbi:LamG-like jellyroll fold domain-containing protein [Dyadobacter sp. 32]|uniref:LamG-like jellyroll fold domain-containing protein n=1 Tax=Dyadobacter sp. 32 TaxID=538966 RepID=UPI0039C6A9C5